MSFSMGAMADATFDLVDALVKKGVLTEEEALPLLAGRENDIKAADKKVGKAARVTISDVIDNATVYGDVRVREEYRKGGSGGNEEERERGRYKLTFGVETKADDFYTDLAFAMGANGRSDNATFAGSSQSNGVAANGNNTKETLFVKRALVGWKVTDWLAVEAGRIKNPLYTTSMVWDGDLTFEGAAEKINYTYNKIDFFGNFVQSQYLGDYKNFSPATAGTDRITNNILAFQGGLKFPITDLISAKAAITYTTYSNNKTGGNAGTGGSTAQNTFSPGLRGTSATAGTGTNDLSTIEIPAEIEFKTSGNLSYKVFGDYVYNTSGSDRFDKAVASGATAPIRAALQAAGNDDTAWLLGAGIASAQDKKPKKGDWQARFWWQDVGIYALDQNAVDSDLMDSRVNMKGIVAKGTYNLRDNVFVDVTGASATRKNSALATAFSSGNDIGLDLDKYQLLQLDLTYKF
ncbi:MAG TPA: putative porin [Methyloradius sp.]